MNNNFSIKEFKKEVESTEPKILIGKDFVEFMRPIVKPLIWEPKRGETKVIIIAGDRGTTKTTGALIKSYDQFYLKKELFVFAIWKDKLKTKMKKAFSPYGWTIIADIIYDSETKEIVGFLIAINTFDDVKNQYLRFQNITTIIYDEIVPEVGKVHVDVGKAISSINTSIWGQEKLSKWRELGLQALFLTNNINADHPVFYHYGFPNVEFGIMYKRNKEIALISLVNTDNGELDDLLTLGGYDKLAYGRKQVLDEEIIIKNDFTLDGWEYLFNVILYDEKGSVWMKENEMLIHDEPDEDNDDYIYLGSDDPTNDEINYDFLSNLSDLSKENMLKFTDWKWKRLFIKSKTTNYRRL